MACGPVQSLFTCMKSSALPALPVLLCHPAGKLTRPSRVHVRSTDFVARPPKPHPPSSCALSSCRVRCQFDTVAVWRAAGGVSQGHVTPFLP